MMLFSKQIAKFSVTTLAAFTLAACGSSNSDSSTTTTTTTPPNVSPSQPQASPKVTGAAITISGMDHPVLKISKIEGYTPYKLNVDGTELTIGGPGISSGSWLTLRDANHETMVVAYKNSSFGAIRSQHENAKDYLFYNGNPTANMPTTGTASYEGRSILSAANIESDDDYLKGTSRLNANFADKTLTGSLNFNEAIINVNSRISGNSFTGSANSFALIGTGKVEGKFYGNNAKELGGMVSAANQWGAAFGAEKK